MFMLGIERNRECDSKWRSYLTLKLITNFVETANYNGSNTLRRACNAAFDGG